MDLLTKAAELAESTAQNALAYMYKMGVAVDVDHYKVRKLLLSHDQSFDIGSRIMILMTRWPRVLPSHTNKAKELFAAAADAGQGEALYHLGEYALEVGHQPQRPSQSGSQLVIGSARR